MPGSEGEREASTKGLAHTEVYPLLMFAVGGMMLFPASGDLLTMFVALEVLSLPLYLLCGLARRPRLLSQEAALKYFLLGAFSSGFFLYGAALLYGYAGSMDFAAINEAVRNDVGSSSLLLIGTGLLSVGLLFKVGAVPFHMWTPDVYQGAPTPVTGYMSAIPKIAAFAAAIRLLVQGLAPMLEDWDIVIAVLALLAPSPEQPASATVVRAQRATSNRRGAVSVNESAPVQPEPLQDGGGTCSQSAGREDEQVYGVGQQRQADDHLEGAGA